MEQPNKILGVHCKDEGDFFAKWIEYLTPKHHLTKVEQKFLVACLKQYYQLSKGITDKQLLDETVLNEAYRAKLRQELGMSIQQFQNIIGKLKKLKILIPKNYPFSEKASYYKISPSFIPNFSGDDFTLILLFRIDGAEDNQTSSKGV